MSRIAPIFCILCLALLIPPGAASGDIARDAAAHQDLRITIDPAASSMHGVATLTLPAQGRPLRLLLSRRAMIEDVRIGTLPSAEYRFENGLLTIFVPTIDAGETSVRVAYRAAFDDPVPENPAHDEDPGYGVTAAITERGVFLGAGAFWYPLLRDRPASFRLRVEAPPGMEAVAAGRLVERGRTERASYSVWESEIPLEPLTLAAGPYRVKERRVPGATLQTFLYPDNAHLAQTYLDASADYLDLYQRLFGTYPFAKFAVAENFFPTGYGFPSWTLLGSTVVRLPFIVDTSLGHEIAHSWWGNGVQVDHTHGNWSEGLTTYVADHLFKVRKSPGEGREYRLKILRDYTTLVSPTEAYPLSRFISRKTAVDQAIGYGKGAMVFHMARQLIGEEAFWGGLRNLVESHLHREASWSDFIAAWRKVADADLSDFVRQWVERPGAPVLELADISASETEDGWRVKGRLTQRPPFYELQVPLRLETADGPIDVSVALHDGAADFEIRSSASPIRLVTDPDVDIFRRLHPQEIPPTVNTLRGSDSLLAVAGNDLPEEILTAAKGLLAALRQPRTKVVRESDLEAEELSGKDLLFIGRPADPNLQPALPPTLGLSEGGFSVDGNRYTDEGAALFAALPHPTDSSRGAALFLPLSAEAARLALRKIPHYGKYSYLAFVAGENRAKGTWPATSTPLIHEFARREAQP